MTLPVDVLAQEVLCLSARDRALLFSRLIESMELDVERDARWDAVAARRDAQADADPSLLVPGDEALARVRAQVA